MDQRLKNIVDHFDEMRIGADESFKFHCTMCGKCCIDREDILLNPRDVFNMANELEIGPMELIKEYCEIYIGSDSRILIVRLRPQGSNKRCPLLQNRKCRVHQAKQTVCAMFPIGRGMVLDREKKTGDSISANDIQFIFSNPNCGDNSETHTVREWLTSFGIPVQDKFFVKWNQTIMKMRDIFRKMEKGMNGTLVESLRIGAFRLLYLEYNPSEEFLPQFEKNTEKVICLLQKILVKQGGENCA